MRIVVIVPSVSLFTVAKEPYFKLTRTALLISRLIVAITHAPPPGAVRLAGGGIIHVIIAW